MSNDCPLMSPGFFISVSPDLSLKLKKLSTMYLRYSLLVANDLPSGALNLPTVAEAAVAVDEAAVCPARLAAGGGEKEDALELDDELLLLLVVPLLPFPRALMQSSRTELRLSPSSKVMA